MMSNTLITLMKSQTVTIEIGRLSIGSMIRRKMFHSPAPSTRADKMISVGMPFSAAESNTIAKPVEAQTYAMMIAYLTVFDWPSQETGFPPKAWMTAFTVPMSGFGL